MTVRTIVLSVADALVQMGAGRLTDDELTNALFILHCQPDWPEQSLYALLSEVLGPERKLATDETRRKLLVHLQAAEKDQRVIWCHYLTLQEIQRALNVYFEVLDLKPPKLVDYEDYTNPIPLRTRIKRANGSAVRVVGGYHKVLV